VEDWAEIRRLRRAEGLPIVAIARRMGIARNTVKRALASDEPPRYRRMPKGSIVDLSAGWPTICCGVGGRYRPRDLRQAPTLHP
jgi:transcriptional regulator with XRE-family HTH domain